MWHQFAGVLFSPGVDGLIMPSTKDELDQHKLLVHDSKWAFVMKFRVTQLNVRYIVVSHYAKPVDCPTLC